MKRIGQLLLITSLLCCTGCYYSAQSFNHGKLLNPGDAMFTVGAGTFRTDSTMTDSIPTGSQMWRHVALNYQLGVHEKYPFGGGIEVGIHTEFAYYKIGKMRVAEAPPVVDFNARLGFKDIVHSRFIYQHNVELGWSPGMWIDNGWFLGYAGGWEFPRVIPYVGVRGMILPTNIMETKLTSDDVNFFAQKSKHTYNVRGAVGISVKIPKKRLLPDYITPEITIIGPNASKFAKVNSTFHVGFRWTNGL